MKKILSLLLLLSCLLTLVACGGEEPEYPEHYGYKMISDPSIVEYYFYVPEDWVVDEQTGMTSAHLSARDRTNVSVTTYEASSALSTMEAFWTKYEQDFTATYGEIAYTTAADGTQNRAIARTLGGQPALAYEYKRAFLGTTYCVNQALVMYQNRFYLFTFMGLAGEGNESYAPNVDTGCITDMLTFFAFK